jgi:replicative DNA helicase
MAAHEELELVAKIVDSGDLKTVLDAGITIDHFAGMETGPAFNYILKYYRDKRTVGEVPTRDLLERRFKHAKLPRKNRMSINAVLDAFKNQHVTASLMTLADYIQDNSDEPDKVLHHIRHKVAGLAAERRISSDLILAESLKSAVEDYETRRDHDGYLGIPWPWEVLNEETGGILDEQFIILYGRPKSMKTWTLLCCAAHAYDYASRKVLVYSREMSVKQMRDRTICIMIGAPYDAFRKARLKEIPGPDGYGTMEDMFYEVAETLYEDEQTCAIESGYNKSIIFTNDRDDPRGGGVFGIQQKVDDHKPDLICVDAMYLLRNDRDNRRSVKWQDQYAITQDVKDLAANARRPLIATSQANRGSEEGQGKVSNLAFGDSGGMDCDMAIEIWKKETPDPEKTELGLIITAAREIRMGGFGIHGNAAADFSECMMKLRDETGMPVLDNGKPVMVPAVFHTKADAVGFLKDKRPDTKKEREKVENTPDADEMDEVFSSARRMDRSRDRSGRR